ncbi:Flavinator of succinate dehydrogenase [Pseudocohnilembus persalinus]|uniref:Flavinator of succinate dehydrogenase n=1 Tax=Pseudocohnilembus persalinus TaxID=266149 RepID=A0A0V0QMK3_PSEPJ|nr:Flavinator of succinate dehydrogenase [Pseudocohnilembus persalinus]|eukprot:KRX03356.1 Flavinator of succinate dehydrogenase [Pseudocohnilembus persalinus]
MNKNLLLNLVRFQKFQKNLVNQNSFKFCTKDYEGLFYDAKVKSHTMEQDIDALRRQIYFRANNMGMKELDLIVGTWIKKNVNNMNMEELQQFHREILEYETPLLTKIILGQEEFSDNTKYQSILRDWAFNEKNKQLY